MTRGTHHLKARALVTVNLGPANSRTGFLLRGVIMVATRRTPHQPSLLIEPPDGDRPQR